MQGDASIEGVLVAETEALFLGWGPKQLLTSAIFQPQSILRLMALTSQMYHVAMLGVASANDLCMCFPRVCRSAQHNVSSKIGARSLNVLFWACAIGRYTDLMYSGREAVLPEPASTPTFGIRGVESPLGVGVRFARSSP